ncbi:MAG: rRNA pseudouridine synthase [Oscillospiraceae bacterium]|nr:rRNA pseudouridine synthase [Oscillospiraceae bacterium]
MKQRLQKIIADAGICSRRAAEQLILSGRISVNGTVVGIGSSADPQIDKITFDNIPVKYTEKKLYIMLNKPKGYVTTANDEKGRKTVMELVSDVEGRVFPVGRLDMYSEGLLLLTNDGEFANKMTHPSHKVKKKYLLSVTGTDIRQAAEKLGGEPVIDGYKIKPVTVTVCGDHGGKTELTVTVSEGRNRQIRKMCSFAGLKLHMLRRISVGPLELGDLPPGKWRHLTDAEVSALLLFDIA